MLKPVNLILLSVLISCTNVSALGSNIKKPFKVVFVSPKSIKEKKSKKIKKKRSKKRISRSNTNISVINHKLSSIQRKKVTHGKKRRKTGSYKPFRPSSIYQFGNQKLSFPKARFDFWVKYFTRNQRARFLRFFNNGQKVQNIVKSTMKEYGLPEELFYVGFIESGYNFHAKSHASAVGPWQFIKGTGLRYGLRIDRSVDERRNIYKASIAAAKYFKDLYNIFGSWDLAMAAYNAGEYRIINAIRKGKTRKFIELVKKNRLPKETAYYVPKVMAVKHILENPRKYGFKLPRIKSSVYDEVHKTKLKYPFSLKAIANKTKIPYSVLKKLNADINHKWTHVDKKKGHEIFLPKKMGRGSIYKKLTQKNPYINSSLRKYTVSAGDSLIGISYKFDVSLTELKSVNKLNRNHIRRGQRLIIPFKTKSKVHVVKKGESIFRIAQKYGINLSHIFRANDIKNGKIYPGQKLVVPIDI